MKQKPDNQASASHPPAKERLTTTRLQHFARAYTQSAVLFAAMDLDVFSQVEEGADSFQSLAKACGLSELNMERLTTTLLAMDLLRLEVGTEPEGEGEGKGEKLVNAPDVSRYLVAGKRTFAAPWMNFTRPRVADWFELTGFLQDETPPSRLGEGVDMPVEEARRYHSATYSVGMGAGRLFCRQVDLAGRKHLLDLGGGSGAYCINAVKAFDGLTATVLDLPGVVEVAREFIEENGVSDRVKAVPGDFTSAEYPACDVVLMASNLPMYGAEGIRDVVAKAFNALEPGGEMHLVGEVLNDPGDDEGVGPLDASLWGLQEVFRKSEGRAHTGAEVQSYFREAGFTQIETSPFVPGVLKRVKGVKP